MRGIRLNRFVMPLVVAIALLGTVWIAKGVGAWQTSGRGQIMLDASGQPDPQGIKGWMTLTDVSQTYEIPLEALYAMTGAVSDLPADTALKDLEALLPSFGVSGVRLGVAAYRNGL